MVDESTGPAPTSIPKRTREAAVTKEKPKGIVRQIVAEGVKYDVNVVLANGQYILTESLHKEVRLPGTNKTTKILIAAKGTPIS